MKRRRSRILILHHAPLAAGGKKPVWRESDAGVMAEVEAVAAALDRLGYGHRTAGAAQLTELPSLLAAATEEVVFNLVESFAVRPADANLVPAVARAFGKSCTGSDTTCLALALDKGRTKAVLQAADLPCPGGVMIAVGAKVERSRLPAGPWIVKPAHSDASEGIDAACVIRLSAAAPKAADPLAAAVRRVHREFGQPAIVEQFIAGRELNVSVLSRLGAAEVLPIAEIDFSAFPAGVPRIVDYAAKWLPESFAYQNTPRVIPARLTRRQAEAVRQLALGAWRACGCRGYARVDMRMTAAGRPLVLEVNPNPDISLDAGFAAALAAAGIPYEEFVEAAIRDACDS
jgi:D-alanine-D-alanine ligase